MVWARAERAIWPLKVNADRAALLGRDADQRHDEEIHAPVTVELCELRRDATPLARELGDLEQIFRSRVGSPYQQQRDQSQADNCSPDRAHAPILTRMLGPQMERLGRCDGRRRAGVRVGGRLGRRLQEVALEGLHTQGDVDADVVADAPQAIAGG